MSGGFLEGIVRGYKAGLLTSNHYANLQQCETLEGMCTLKSRLSGRVLQLIRKDEADRERRELDERLRKEVEETERTERERARRAIEEKENAQVERHSPPHGNRQIASLPSRQSYYNFPKMGLNGMRAGVSAMKSNVPKINETDVIEEESDYAEYGTT